MAIRFDGRFKPQGRIRIRRLISVPEFVTSPSISPASAKMGTTFTGDDGVYRQGSVTSRAWLLDNKIVPGATTNTYVPDGYGSLVYRVTISGNGGTLTQSSDPVTVLVEPANLHPPTWAIATGNLGTFAENTSISISLLTNDEDNNVSSYAVQSGTLPNGTSLDPFSGVIAGTLAEVTQDTVYSFTIKVTDRTNLTLTGDFSINVANVKTTVVWNTDNNSDLASPAPGEPVSVQMGATSK